MTHAELVVQAERWLRRRLFAIVLSDVKCVVVNEQPDAIAWTGRGLSTLVECKATRSDYLRDAQKWFRRAPERGMGRQRWYFTAPGVVSPAELPFCWGLAVYDGKRVSMVRKPEPFLEWNRGAEQALLVTALRRATEGWGRKMFGEIAPPGEDGDPHPSATRIIRELRAENARLRKQLGIRTRDDGRDG